MPANRFFAALYGVLDIWQAIVVRVDAALPNDIRENF